MLKLVNLMNKVVSIKSSSLPRLSLFIRPQSSSVNSNFEPGKTENKKEKKLMPYFNDFNSPQIEALPTISNQRNIQKFDNLSCLIRKTSNYEFPIVVNLLHSMGYCESLELFQLFYALSQTELFGAYNLNNELIGNCCATRLEHDFGVIGHIDVVDHFDSSKIFGQLLKKGTQYLSNHNVCLNVLPENINIYDEFELFKVYNSGYVNQIFRGPITKNVEENLIDVVKDIDVLPYHSQYRSAIEQYDYQLFSCGRNMVNFCLESHYSLCMVALDQITGHCRGYGVVRDNIQGGVLLSPLYADTPEIAEALVKGLLKNYPRAKEELTLQGISFNKESLKLAQKLDLLFFRDVSRYYTKKALPKVHCEHIYSQLNFNFSLF